MKYFGCWTCIVSLGGAVAGFAACGGSGSADSLAGVGSATTSGPTGAGGAAGSATATGSSTSNGGSISTGVSTSTGGAGGVSTSTGGAGGGSTSTGGTGGASTGSPAGSHCTQASDCQSGTCTGGFCIPPGLPNTTCMTGADCASGVCNNGKCVIPPGATGSVDPTECTAGSLGCACQPMNKCKAGLICTGGICCNAKTGSCTPGTGQMDAGVPDSGGSTPSACTPGMVGPVITECGYPFASPNPLTDILFNESTVLAAIVPSGGYPFASIQLFYNDEHAMTLGVHKTVINGVSTDYPVSPLMMSPAIVDNPQTGTNLITGQQAGVDPVGRPMWPALFITDITSDVNNVSGDWQWGGPAVNPTYIAGTWKGAVRTVDATGASITFDVDPVKNGQNYGNGHMAPPGAITKAEAYGTEVRWDIRLQAGHNYRFQVMVHDGDQNKIGGDSGEACVTFCAGNMCPEGSSSCTASTECTNGNVCADGCCYPPPPSGSDAGTPGSDASTPGSDAGSCPPGWSVPPGGGTICTPPPTNGQCPPGYVITIVNGKQYCTRIIVN